MDLALDANHDLALSDDGNIGLTSGIPLAAAQRLSIHLSMFLGEWFLDQRAGLPYFQEIFLDVPDDSTLRTIFRREVQSDAYVVAVPTCDVTVNRTTRNLDVSFSAQLIEGSEISVSLSSGLVDGQIVFHGIGIVLNGVPIVLG